MRKITVALCGWLALAALAMAADFAALKPQGYISDYAGVIDPAAKAALEQYCALVETKTGAQIAVLTVPSLEGEPVEDVANSVFRKWGVGQKTTNEGLLLLLATQDRRMRLEVGYGLEPILPDGFSGSVLRAMSPFLRESRYGAAITEAVQTIGTRVAEAKGVTLDGSLPRPTRRPARSTPFPVVVFGVIMLLWVIGAMRGGGEAAEAAPEDLGPACSPECSSVTCWGGPRASGTAVEGSAGSTRAAVSAASEVETRAVAVLRAVGNLVLTWNAC